MTRPGAIVGGGAGLRQWYAAADKRELLKLVFYTAALVGVLFLLLTGRSYRFKDQLFALVIGVPTILLFLLQLAFLLRPDLRERFGPGDGVASSLQEKFSRSIEGTSEEGRTGAERRRVEALLIVWIAALPVAMYYLGMAVVPVYVFAFVWYFHGSVRAAAATSGLFTLTVYVIFVIFLRLTVWEGVLFA